MGDIVTGKTGVEQPWNWRSKGRCGQKGNSCDRGSIKEMLNHLCHEQECLFSGGFYICESSCTAQSVNVGILNITQSAAEAPDAC